ncbi:hypothetical protein Fot_38863 [Forsythia ovata]|uniref:Uncharacterized protein n=1 Tax=Forsythia ovata TaxID=205694 RepID=A0ABD1S3R3_9LAMI
MDLASFPVQPEISAVDEPLLLEWESENRIMEVKAVMVNGAKVDIDQTGEEIDADAELDGEDKFVISSSTYTPPHAIISPDVQSEFLSPESEKPLVPSTSRRHRKTTRANSKGARAPKLARSKKQDTLESTWKMITAEHHMPLTTHLNKSDTREHHRHHVTTSLSDHVPKSKTFKNRMNYESPLEASLGLSSNTNISRESSPSQDELNRRVESFIEKFNEEMRLQRQESLNQYMEMINRGV